MHHFVVCCGTQKPDVCELIQPFIVYPLLLSQVSNYPLRMLYHMPFETTQNTNCHDFMYG